MTKTKFEEMFDRLPSNVKDSEVLRIESKKILAALLELLLHSEAKNSGIIYVGNGKLRRLSGVGSDNLLSGIQQLEDYELITRVKGSVRKVQTEKGQASEYRINFKKLKEPIVEKTFDDLFSEFLQDEESLEKPISTTITTTITTSNTTATSNTIATASSIESTTKTTTSTLTSTETTNGITCNNILYDNNPLEEKDNLIDKSTNSNNIVTDYVNKQLEGKTTYSELVKQFTPIHQWIFSNWSNDNAERLVTVANKLINEKLKEVETIKTETVDVDSCQSV